MVTLIDFLYSSIILSILIALGSLPSLISRIKLGLRKSEFKCLRCGNCCRFYFTELTKEDIKRLENAGYENFWEVREGKLCMKTKLGHCWFLENDRCKVYPLRPTVCREFPFFKLFGIIPIAHNAKNCPGLQAMRKK